MSIVSNNGLTCVSYNSNYTASMPTGWVITRDSGANWETLTLDDGYGVPAVKVYGCNSGPAPSPSPSPSKSITPSPGPPSSSPSRSISPSVSGTPQPGTQPSVDFSATGASSDSFEADPFEEKLAELLYILRDVISVQLARQRDYKITATFYEPTDEQLASIKQLPINQTQLDSLGETLGLSSGALSAVYVPVQSNTGDGDTNAASSSSSFLFSLI